MGTPELKSLEAEKAKVAERIAKAKEEMAQLEARSMLITLHSIISQLTPVPCYRVITFEKNYPYPSSGSYESGCYTDEKEAKKIAELYNVKMKVRYISLTELTEYLNRDQLNSNPYLDSGY